jgi:hypothetical protein
MTFTDEHGRFALTHVPAGPCTVTVQGLDLEHRRIEVHVAPGEQPAPVEITLYPFRPQVVFQFTDTRGRPVAGQALFQTYTNGFGGLQTDGEGVWRDQWMDSGAKRCLFGWPTIGWAELTVVVEEGIPETPVRVILAPGANVSGTVRERGSGDPVGGVAVYPHRAGPAGEHEQLSPWTMLFIGFHSRLVSGYPVTQVSRDGDGTYRLSNLPPGEYRIAGRRLSIGGPQEIENFDLEVDDLPEKRWVLGRVTTPGGEPLCRVEVTVIMDHEGPDAHMGPMHGIPRRVLTDEIGRFRLGPCAAREYWLTAEIPGHRSATTMVDVTTGSVDAGDFLLAESEYTLAAER